MKGSEETVADSRSYQQTDETVAEKVISLDQSARNGHNQALTLQN